jgi:hypothetical protein
MLSFALLALGAAIVAATAAMTAARYATLPGRMPTHFGLDGRVDGYGPKPVVWLMVALQCVLLAGYAVPLFAFGAQTSAARAWLVFGDCIAAILWQTQRQVLQAATTGRLTSVAGYWTFFAVAMTTGVLGLLAFLTLER